MSQFLKTDFCSLQVSHMSRDLSRDYTLGMGHQLLPEPLIILE